MARNQRYWALVVSLFFLLGGCSSPVIHPASPDTVIVVPGIGGDGPEYGGVGKALRDAGSNDCLQVFEWGLHMPLFFITISDRGLHERTEKRLAELVTRWHADHPHARIVLIAHSAGAGVVLGMLPRLDPAIASIGSVILLAPALSPQYDLAPALHRVTAMHVFYSEDDDFWQGLGPSLFGNYDGHHESGAGRRGFEAKSLTPDQRQILFQHPFETAWKKYGNHGGHYDWLAHDFVIHVLKPLIDSPATRP
ncbi:MAG: alpha/beta hydrolase [Planctomycetota bacterium]|nr:alpha/beta hydrolase [Planctomycetota bacterium]